MTPTELSWQQEIVKALVQDQGYRHLSQAAYDQQNAIIPSEFLAFIEATQPELRVRHTDDALLDGLVRAIDRPDQLVKDAHHPPSVLDAWRRGFALGDDTVRLALWQPRDAVDPRQKERYERNRLAVIQELHYDPRDGADKNRLDLALFLNGIPIVTVELKNQFTGQGTRNAVEQYRCDRSPQAPIFTFPHRAIVHFAVDRENARMATRLNGSGTNFLPFNRGRDGRTGNPPIEGRPSTAYLWTDIDQVDERPGATGPRRIRAAWSRDRLLDVLQSYATLEPPDLTDHDKVNLDPLEKARRSTLIFPRYHQYDAVDDMLTHTVRHGVGHRYLVKHSTGSGKSYTMAWLAHQLASLHREDGQQKVFGTVIIVTDRLQLDSQLRELVKSVSSYDNVHVAENTEQLGQHLREKAAGVRSSRIITTTLQKFFHLQKAGLGGSIQSDAAIIIDEAHSSQGSTLQESMEEVLNTLAAASSASLSYYAFTATPKGKTREIFGMGEEGQKVPFHVYGMRQAREEGFIVDVLQNMVFLAQAAELGTDKPEDRVSSGSAAALAAEKPELIELKSSYILKHIRDKRIVQALGNSGRAMVLASSVTAGVRYFRALRRLIRERGLDLRVLVAFTGDHPDPDLPEVPGVKQDRDRVSELRLNDGGAAGLGLAKKLRETHHILVAVNKFQTGFNEPRLMALYVDKGLREINAVQTLSRLNRQHKGMKGPNAETLPHVVDFVNDPESIIAAFVEEDEGSLRGYQFLTREYVEELYGQLNLMLDEDLLPGFLAIESAYRQARRQVAPGDPTTAADSGSFAHFFAERYQAFKDLTPDRKVSVRADLKRYLTYWPLACLVLKQHYPDGSELRRTRGAYRRMVKRFYHYVRHSDDVHDDARTLGADDVYIEGSVSLLELHNPIERWEEHVYGDPGDGETPMVVSEPEPMQYTVARRKRVVPRRIIELIERYNATVGAVLDDAEARGAETGKVLSILEQVANRVHQTPILAGAARTNEERQYAQLYKQVWERTIDDLADKADDEAKGILEFMSRAPASSFDDWASDSYQTHKEEGAA